MIVTLAGGVGAARFIDGLVQVHDPRACTTIVNVADDVVLHGLAISPDLDTVTYTLAGEIDPERGWGLRGETWQAMQTVGRYGGISWFNLGDRDLGTHMYRTHRLGEGATLTEVTAEIVRAWGLELAVLPVSDDRVETRVVLRDGDTETAAGGEVNFQEYFVKRHHGVAVSSVRFVGAEVAHPAPGVLDALASADLVVIAPSNPIVSIGPVLAIPGVRDALASRRDRAVAISPIVGGAALKGPADRMLVELGHESSVVGVARLYRDLASVLVIDHADRDLARAVEDAGMRCVVTDTIMASPERSAALARTTIGVHA
jgi:LPPG:FO 2-phospho-L-lactate transferase